MTIAQARAIAGDWLRTEGAGLAGLRGAFTHGSTNWLPAVAELPAGSDLDLLLVIDAPPPNKLGKFEYDGVLLEVSYLPSSEMAAPELILSTSWLAGSFATATILADPEGWLSPLQATVAEQYPKRRWILARIEYVRQKIQRNLDGIDPAAPWDGQVANWLFATGLTTHLLLVAGLRNPTVRRRYVAVRELLADLGMSEEYEPLLAMLGCADWTPEDVARHLETVTAMFDTAAGVIRSPFPYAADISPAARPIVVVETERMIAHGDHREAVFWLVATACRCRAVLRLDGSEVARQAHEPGFRALLAALGVGSAEELKARRDELPGRVGRAAEVAGGIIAANATARP